MNISKAMPSIVTRAATTGSQCARHVAGAAVMSASTMSSSDDSDLQSGNWSFVNSNEKASSSSPSSTSISQELWTQIPNQARQVVLDSGMKPGTAVRVTERLVDKFVHDPYVLACVEQMIEEETDNDDNDQKSWRRVRGTSQTIEIEMITDDCDDQSSDAPDKSDYDTLLTTVKYVVKSLGRFVHDGVIYLGELMESIFVWSPYTIQKPDPIINTLIGTITIIAAIGTALTLLSY